MNRSIWQRMDGAARGLAPFTMTLLLVIVGMLPWGLPSLSPVLPSVALIAVYYWSVHRPELMPLWAVFVIGLFQDLMHGGALGAGIIMLLSVQLIVTRQHRFFASASFMLIWSVFILLAAAAFLLYWFLSCIGLWLLLDTRPAAFQYLTTIAAYPCFAWLFAQAQRVLLR